MAEFDRRATALDVVNGLSDNEICRVGELRVTGGKFAPLMGEFRDALRNAYEQSTKRPDAVKVVDRNVLVPAHNESELSELFIAVDAVWQLRLSDFSYDHDGRMADFVECALSEVFTIGMSALIDYVEDQIESAERDHVDEDDEEEGTGGEQ